MTIAHLIYIPFAVLVGFYGGWMLGTRSVRQEWDRAEKRRKARDGS